LLAAATHLRSFPQQFGEWQLLNEEPIGADALQMLSCAGYVNREYVNRKSGQSVSIAIIVGPPGPISVHTPEICFSSRAYTLSDEKVITTINDREGRAHTFWSIAFQPNNPSADQLRVIYAWTASDTWIAAKAPRFEFARQRTLFKLQLASVVSAPTDRTNDPCHAFLVDLLNTGWNTKE
jgi:hypothetical protein